MPAPCSLFLYPTPMPTFVRHHKLKWLLQWSDQSRDGVWMGDIQDAYDQFPLHLWCWLWVLIANQPIIESYEIWKKQHEYELKWNASPHL